MTFGRCADGAVNLIVMKPLVAAEGGELAALSSRTSCCLPPKMPSGAAGRVATGGMKDQSHDDEQPLRIWGSGTQESKAGLRNGVVFRQAGPWSSTVVALLRHLEAAGSTFRPPPDACWKPWFARTLPGSDPVIGHGDTGPWNIIRNDDHFSLIDWEFAGPVDSTWELAEAAWLNAQLHDDDGAERFDLPDVASRARQVRLLADAYGLSAAQRAGFVDRMIEFAVHSSCQEAVEYGVTPESRNAVSDSGFPFLWGITWRTCSASWMLRNRPTLERALH